MDLPNLFANRIGTATQETYEKPLKKLIFKNQLQQFVNNPQKPSLVTRGNEISYINSIS